MGRFRGFETAFSPTSRSEVHTHDRALFRQVDPAIRIHPQGPYCVFQTRTSPRNYLAPSPQLRVATKRRYDLKKRWSWGGQNWDDFNIAIPLLGLSSGAQLLSVLMKGQAASCPISHFPTPPGGSRGWYWNFHFQVADISKLRITCIYWSSHPFVSLSLASIGIIVQGAILSCPGLPAFIVAASKSIVLYQPEWSLKNIDHITLSPTPPSVLNSIGLLLHLILKIWFFFFLSQFIKQHIM